MARAAWLYDAQTAMLAPATGAVVKDEAVGLAVGSEVEARAMATPGSAARVVVVKAAAATGREMVGATAVKRVVPRRPYFP